MSAEFKAILDGNEKKGAGRRITYFFGIIVGILTPAAYLVGYSYYQGYLGAFGVDSDNFPVSSSDVYVFSYQAFGLLLLGVGEFCLVLISKFFSKSYAHISGLVFFSLVIVVYFYLKILKIEARVKGGLLSACVNRIVLFFNPGTNDLVKSILMVSVFLYVLSVLMVLTGAFALFWWFIPLMAHHKGESIAMDRISVFVENGCGYYKKEKWNNCFQVLDGDKKVIREGLLIGVNEKEIAMFEKNGSFIFQKKPEFVLVRSNYREKNN